MNIKFKKLHPEAKIPKYATKGAAGLDLYAINCATDDYDNIIYHTGIAIEIPEGYVGLLFPRSSCCYTDLMLTNCVGVIDSDYRGEILIKYKLFPHMQLIPEQKIISGEIIYTDEDRVGQLVIMPVAKVKLEEVLELSETNRGENGFGHTGR